MHDKLYSTPKRLTAFFLSAAVMLTLLFSYAGAGISVRVDGKLLGVVSYSGAEELLNVSRYSSLGSPASPTFSFSLSPTLAPYSDFATADQLAESMPTSSDLSEYRYAVYVDGALVGGVRAVARIKSALASESAAVSACYTTVDSVTSVSRPNIEIKYELTEPKYFKSQSELLTALSSDSEVAAEWYTVAQDDTVFTIMRMFELTSDELVALNPGVNVEFLTEGDVICVKAARSALTATVKTVVSSLESTPYETVYRDDPDVRDGFTVVRRGGRNGLVRRSYSVTYENGVETSRTLISESEVYAATSKIVSVGCKNSNFYLNFPVYSKLTCDYGERILRGSKNFHHGIDLKAPYDTEVMAAAAGTVVVSGVTGNGAYGNLIVIDHGNGYKTYYAHNDKLLKKVGDEVLRGEVVALSGSTGNSTGPHVHFEVRYDNVAINPWDLMEYRIYES